MRIKNLQLGEMNHAQRTVAEEVMAGPRGHFPAPMRVWIRSPEIAERAGKLGEFLRYKAILPPLLSELSILVTARHWNSRYVWYGHIDAALDAGLTFEAAKAISERQKPIFSSVAEDVVYRFAGTLLKTGHVDDDVYGEGIHMLGEEQTVELVSTVGYYCLVALTLGAFDITPPEPGIPPLAP